ncbi:unnamed protein product, partial [Iphiclides podalirius]
MITNESVAGELRGRRGRGGGRGRCHSDARRSIRRPPARAPQLNNDSHYVRNAKLQLISIPTKTAAPRRGAFPNDLHSGGAERILDNAPEHMILNKLTTQ